jgi:hypothetical protein
MTAVNQELLFALRHPHSQSLAMLVLALDEALRDPAFDTDQRALLVRLIGAGQVMPSLREAAESRAMGPASAPAADPAEEFSDVLAWLGQAQPAQPARPKLTLVGSAAA